ncbi:hypothetical protein [Paraburkholderia graminis]|uniref:hypothetical protein n=1 Tax=Paraburkholderia graminis TaxID=60548 RepID=UPI00278CE1BC|nr:hypothetical protein [Paraburkholderia graminis]MDQ0620998.1 hypothetical protein [Paraburkholderia graminis]
MKTPLSKLQAPTAEPEDLIRLDQPDEEWPKGLFRFALFTRKRDGDDVLYRSVCWNPVDRKLHVLRLIVDRAPTGPGDWLVWTQDAPDKPLSDIRLVDETVVPAHMTQPLERLPEEERKGLNGFRWRDRIVRAFCQIDKVGEGRKEDMVFNEKIVLDDDARISAAHRIREALGKPRGWETHVRKLFHQFCHFAGVPGAMLAQHSRKGRTGPRTGLLVNKPGRLSTEEERAKLRSEATGKPVTFRRKAVDLIDEEKILDVLRRYHRVENLSLGRTYDKLVLEHYADADERVIPTLESFRVHANKLIALHDIERGRKGDRVHKQQDAARRGQATDYTGGKIEIVDIDAFTAKIGVAVKVRGRSQSTYVKVVLAASRNSHAILGEEIVLRGEKASAYRRCIASIYLDKTPKAIELGLKSTKGLLDGTIDGFFADNGAGPAFENQRFASKQMRFDIEVAPPASGASKGVIEGINGLMVQFMLEEDAGWSRATDPVQKERRRKALLAKPISLRRLEGLLYKAIDHHNLHADRSHLRPPRMVDEGFDGSPAEIHRWIDKFMRKGDRARKLTPRQVFSRFVPWKHYKCQRGIIHFKKKLRFTSPELKALWAEHVKTRASERPPLMIEVKRLDGFLDCLIWKKPNGREGTLHLVDEDARRVAHMTWREHNLSLESDSRREVDNEPARRKSRNALTTVDQGQQIEAAERNRTVTAADEMAGESVPDAKNRTTLARERKWGAKQAQAAGVKAESIVVPEMMQPPKPHGGSIAQSYAERVRALRAAQNGGGSSAR